MPKHTMNTLRAALTIAAMCGAVAWPRAAGAQEPAQRTLEGTWLVQVTTLADCQSRAPLGSFSALLTFAHDGTMVGTTTNPAFAIGQRTADHGVWSRLGGPFTYRASTLALLQFTSAPNLPVSPGFQAGAQRLDQTITVTDPFQFTSEAVVQFFDAGGRKYREGCATAIGRRFQ